ncbi:MAG: isopenicillin N synthase-like dioxygenase [Gammaproteobacteria bacterium]|jgi:isopenicillin N synthase-like dioxygenase
MNARNVLPELDVSSFLSDPSSERAQAFVRVLREACHDPGFCYLWGHDVPPMLDNDIMAAASEFFALPQAQRRALAIGHSPHFRGYTILGDERTGGRADWRDQIDIGPEEPALTMGPTDPAYLRLRGPNQWPASLPDMRDKVTAWMQAMERLGTAMMRALALGLGQPLGHFDAALAPNPYPRVKIIRYPAIEASRKQGGSPGGYSVDQVPQQGLGMHHDSGLLSFILQDDVGGLQVETANGLVEATPRPGAYVMNLGEMLQRATRGYLRATRHGVRSPPAGRERISIAYFFNPRLDAVFQPLTLPDELAGQARGGENVDHNDPIHATFGENTLKIRMRAHPDVTAAYYRDIAQ